ncbi:MAG: hypothetical protein AVDCRST_MAG07-3085, partial [uncultured Frankineae bacterium]
DQHRPPQRRLRRPLPRPLGRRREPGGARAVHRRDRVHRGRAGRAVPRAGLRRHAAREGALPREGPGAGPRRPGLARVATGRRLLRGARRGLL